MDADEFREAVEDLLGEQEGGDGVESAGPITKWVLVAERAWASGRTLHLRSGDLNGDVLQIWDALGMHEAAAADARAAAVNAFRATDDEGEDDD